MGDAFTHGLDDAGILQTGRKGTLGRSAVKPPNGKNIGEIETDGAYSNLDFAGCGCGEFGGLDFEVGEVAGAERVG